VVLAIATMCVAQEAIPVAPIPVVGNSTVAPPPVLLEPDTTPAIFDVAIANVSLALVEELKNLTNATVEIDSYVQRLVEALSKATKKVPRPDDFLSDWEKLLERVCESYAAYVWFAVGRFISYSVRFSWFLIIRSLRFWISSAFHSVVFQAVLFIPFGIYSFLCWARYWRRFRAYSTRLRSYREDVRARRDVRELNTEHTFLTNEERDLLRVNQGLPFWYTWMLSLTFWIPYCPGMIGMLYFIYFIVRYWILQLFYTIADAVTQARAFEAVAVAHVAAAHVEIPPPAFYHPVIAEAVEGEPNPNDPLVIAANEVERVAVRMDKGKDRVKSEQDRVPTPCSIKRFPMPKKKELKIVKTLKALTPEEKDLCPCIWDSTDRSGFEKEKAPFEARGRNNNKPHRFARIARTKNGRRAYIFYPDEENAPLNEVDEYYGRYYEIADQIWNERHANDDYTGGFRDPTEEIEGIRNMIIQHEYDLEDEMREEERINAARKRMKREKFAAEDEWDIPDFEEAEYDSDSSDQEEVQESVDPTDDDEEALAAPSVAVHSSSAPKIQRPTPQDDRLARLETLVSSLVEKVSLLTPLGEKKCHEAMHPENPVIPMLKCAYICDADRRPISHCFSVGGFLVFNKHVYERAKFVKVGDTFTACEWKSEQATTLHSDLVAVRRTFPGVPAYSVKRCQVPMLNEKVGFTDTINSIAGSGFIESLNGEYATVKYSSQQGTCGVPVISLSSQCIVGVHAVDGGFIPITPKMLQFFRGQSGASTSNATPTSTTVATVTHQARPRKARRAPRTRKAVRRFAIVDGAVRPSVAAN